MTLSLLADSLIDGLNNPTYGLYQEDPRIDDALDALGDNIAKSLTDLGITGRRDAIGCPIYNYLVSKGIQIRFVGREYVGVDVGKRVRINRRVTAFLSEFDTGAHNQLFACAPGERSWPS